MDKLPRQIVGVAGRGEWGRWERSGKAVLFVLGLLGERLLPIEEGRHYFLG